MKKAFSIFALCMISASAFAQSTNRPAVLSSGNGRFVFGQISEMARHQYMLDTQTGRLWQIVQTGPNKPDGTLDKDKAYTILDPVPYSELGTGKLSLSPAVK